MSMASTILVCKVLSFSLIMVFFCNLFNRKNVLRNFSSILVWDLRKAGHLHKFLTFSSRCFYPSDQLSLISLIDLFHFFDWWSYQLLIHLVTPCTTCLK